MKMLRTEAPGTPPAGDELATLQRQLPAAAPAVLQRTHKAGALLGQSAARTAANSAATAMFLPLTARAQTYDELFAMQQAVIGRIAQLQQGWLRGWNQWLHDFGQMRQADTLSEHMEQQYNLGARVGALCKQQATDLLSLQENLEVDYGYWLARQARERLQPD